MYVLWGAYGWAIVAMIGTVSIVLMQMIIEKELSLLRSADRIFLASITIYYVVAAITWNLVVYSRRDFLQFLKREKFALVEYSPLFASLTSWLMCIVRARRGDIMMAGRLFGAFGSPLSVGIAGDLTKEGMYSLGVITYTSLVSSSVDVDAEIRICDNEKTLPVTDLPDINEVLQEEFDGVRDFHGRLVLNGEMLQLTVYGGAWLGIWFEDRLALGLRMFERLQKELSKKYPVLEWKDQWFEWDGIRKRFEISARK
jgi:hypothetical protein